MWCVAELGAEYIAKMEDLLAVNDRPYDATAPVVGLDEKPVSLPANRRKTHSHWRFTRRDARRKCGYDTKLFKRSQTLGRGPRSSPK